MTKNSLLSFIDKLEKQNELIRIKEFVNPELEISEFAERMMKQEGGGKALLFENTGTEFPVLINNYGSDKRMCMSLNIENYNEPGERIEKFFGEFLKKRENFVSKLSLLPELINASKWMPKKKSGRGICQEVVMDNPDLNKLPVLKCWHLDGGKFITLPIVISEDPETGIRNIGMYRMQIYNSKSTGMHWHLHKGGAKHYEKHKKAGKKMPVSVVIGGEPVLTYSAIAPLPENIDEILLAGFLNNKGIKLVKCLTNDIYVPENADFVIEGYIDTNEELKIEGPFGDHTGFYSLKDYYPVFHVTCITHKKNAVYPATIVGVPPMEDYYFGKATEKIFLKPIQISIAPEIIDLRLPDYGVAHNLVLVKAKLDYPGQSIKIMNSLLGAGQMMFTKIIICFDESVDIDNDRQVFETLLSNVNISEDIIIGKGPADVLDHSSYTYTFGGKIIIDASRKNNPTSCNPEINTDNNDFSVVFNKSGLCIISANKTKHGNFRKHAENLVKNKIISGLNFLIIIDDFVNLSDKYLLAWYILNNIDLSKDCGIINDTLIIDAGVKTKEHDNFQRDWPNVVSADAQTIKRIDELWKKIFPDNFVESPTYKVRSLIKGETEVFRIMK